MPLYVFDARTATPHFPGIGRYVCNLARELVPLLTPDERLTVLTSPESSVPVPESDQAQLMPVSASPFSLRQQWMVPCFLRSCQASLYHSPYYLMPYRPGVPTVLTIHDLIPIHFPEYSSMRARWLFRAMTNAALRVSCYSIAVSESTRRDTLTYFPVPDDRVTVIPHAADPVFQPQDASSVADLRRRYELPDRFVLYVGSNKPHKNLLGLVSAWAEICSEFPEFVLVIAGPWLPDHPEPRLRAKALGLGPQSIRWLGRVPAQDLPMLYAAAALFVFPSMYEGFGLPVVEAMACGTPVACSAVSSMPEIVGDAALLFDPRVKSDLARAIGAGLSSSAVLSRLSELGIARSSRMSWGRAACQTLALYREICGEV